MATPPDPDQLPTFGAVARRVRHEGLEAGLRGLAELLGSDRHARQILGSIGVSVLLPPLIVALFPVAQLAEGLLELAVLIGPWVALGAILLPWVLGEGNLLRSLFSTFAIGLPDGFAPARLWNRGFPTITLALIAANCLLFFTLGQTLLAEREVVAELRSLPLDGSFSRESPSLLTAVSATFMHASVRHLTGNMFFLWVFGSALEPRIGPGRFATFYSVAGLASAAAELAFGSGEWYVGASGAISGVMGGYMVRLYCARVPMSIPLLGLPIPIGLRFHVPAPLILTLFCVLDLAHRSGRDGVAHYGHLGGYYSGLLLGYTTGLFKQGLREHLLDLGTRAKSESDLYSKREVLDAALELDAEDLDALLARARHDGHVRPTLQGAEDYRKVMARLATRDRRRTAQIFVEYFKLHRAPLEAALQLALTPQLVALRERELAAQALELVLADAALPDALRAQALAYYAKLLVELGCGDAARDRYAELLARYPEHPATAQARVYLEK